MKGEEMSIVLHMGPLDPVLSWEGFCEFAPPYSMAIDGYVNVGPRFDPNGPRVNFNHHEEVDRLATRATCEQVLISIRQGLFDRFRKDNRPTATVYANDCDEDVCTSWYLLKNFVLVENTINLLTNKLVGIEGLMDATAGAYPLSPDLDILQTLNWIFEPYRRFRVSGQIDRRDAGEFQMIVSLVEARIKEYLAGNADKKPLDVNYDPIRQGTGWTMTREIGLNAKSGMFHDKIHAYVCFRERPNGRWSYTIGRMSQYVPFNVLNHLRRLSEAELIKDPASRPFGGGNTIGGCDRALGSTQNPDEVFEVVEAGVREDIAKKDLK